MQISLQFNVKHDTEGMLKSVHKSRRSSKTGKSSHFSSSTVREKRRLLEEARLKVEALEQRQSLECRFEKEEAEFKKRELKIAEDREWKWPCELEDSDKFQARWKHVHILSNKFWARCVKENLPMLQAHQKWLKQKRNFKVGGVHGGGQNLNMYN